MSSLARDKSDTLVCNSVLIVDSSSFTDCNSSLEVSSSSLVDCNSSLTDCISSLDDLSSSVDVSSCSLALWRYSSLVFNSCLSAAMLSSASDECSPLTDGCSPLSASSRTTRYRGDSGCAAAPVETGMRVRLTLVKWELVLTRSPGQRTISLVTTTSRRAVVSFIPNPSRAIFKML